MLADPLSNLKTYARFARGLRGFLRESLTLDEARAVVRWRLAAREENFLRLVGNGVYGYARSPYLPLLRAAQVELGDIREMVRDRGLEGTLRALRGAGVYVTFEEFKGREPLTRPGLELHLTPHDFDNPYLKHYYQAETGGSTGAGTRVSLDLDFLAEEAVHFMLAEEAHGILHVPTAIWFGTFPDASAYNFILRHARYRHAISQWYAVRGGGASRPSLTTRLATRLVPWMIRRSGTPVPRPEPIAYEDALVVARWAAEMASKHGRCAVVTQVSRALRVALAAQEAGLDLTGVTFFMGSEPPTEAKVAGIRRSGADFLPHYGTVELGLVGLGCARPAGPNDVHFASDMLALVPHPRPVPGTSLTVEAFNFTTLMPAAPKLMLNVEMDDYGVVETRACGCPLEDCGLTTHVRDIRSFRKLTGEGVTLVGSDMIHVLEEVLPARFGGSPLDYQLVEEEDAEGFTRLSLIVSPRVALRDEAAVVETVLEALSRANPSADTAQAIWQQAGSLRVKRMEPIRTGRGKLWPLSVERRGDSTDWG